LGLKEGPHTNGITLKLGKKGSNPLVQALALLDQWGTEPLRFEVNPDGFVGIQVLGKCGQEKYTKPYPVSQKFKNQGGGYGSRGW